jgi:hypothetical protein
VKFESGSRLERIGEQVFGWSGLKSIAIPSKVAFICGSAFVRVFLNSVSISTDNQRFRMRDSILEDICGSTIYRYFGACRSVEIPASVIVLGKSCFSCTLLESVTFESGSRLERIEEEAFHRTGLKSIIIPSNVASICGSAFPGSLNSISISPDNQHFRIRDSFLEDINGSTIYRYFGSCDSVMIPSSVLVLGKSSFSWCKSLESVTFERVSCLERIDEEAFRESGLKSIVIPSSVVVFGKSSFLCCNSLDTVTLEDGSRLERIEEFAFYGSGLRSIRIPHLVAFLGRSSFSWCKSLGSVTFESGSRLQCVDESVFADSGVGLTSVADCLAASKSGSCN